MRKKTGLAIALLTVLAAGALPVAAEPGAGWMGILIGETRAAVEDPEDPRPAAVRIAGIFEGSPADVAGLRAKDWILAVDGVAVAAPGELTGRVRDLGEDAWIQLLVERGGRERTLSLRLALRPESGFPKSRLVRGWIGMQTMDLPPKLRARFGAPESAGVMIADLVEGGPAEVAGFELGDVVYAVDGERVESSADLGRLVAGSGVGNEVEFEIARDGAVLVLEALIDRAPETEGRGR